MKKWFLFPLIALTITIVPTSKAQNGCEGYMLVEKGVTLEYTDYDAKNVVTGSRSSTITDLTTNGTILTVTIHSISKDKKGKVSSESDVLFTCENGVIKIDMKSMMDQKMMDGMEGMEMTIDQTNIEFPATFTEGQNLPDGSMNMTVSSGGMQIMKLTAKMTERKVEVSENITTPAGTFNCFKLSQVMTTEMMGRATRTKSVDWFSMGIGSVRSEHFDESGALVSYSVLTNIVR